MLPLETPTIDENRNHEAGFNRPHPEKLLIAHLSIELVQVRSCQHC
jgi:hypothetical protein